MSKKPDPINDKQRALNEEIAALEAEIKKLDSQLARSPSPKYRSTAQPHGQTIPRVADKIISPASAEPVFEEIKVKPLQPRDDSASPDYYNELGDRKSVV